MSAQSTSLDARTHEVAAQIQCPVCNGESIADANSPQAIAMRNVVREQLAQGRSEQQVVQYFVQQYGDTILESPPKQGFTTLIWTAPVLMLLAGIGVLISVGREWRVAHTPSDQSAEPRALIDPDDAMTEDEVERYRLLLRQELEAEEGLPMHTLTEGAS